MERFIKVTNVRDIKPGRAELFQIGGILIAIFNAGGAFYAIEDYCTGDGGSLSEGTLMGTMIQCPSDKAGFYLPTGECIDSVILKRLETYRVRIDGDEIKIGVKEATGTAHIYGWAAEADQRAAS